MQPSDYYATAEDYDSDMLLSDRGDGFEPTGSGHRLSQARLIIRLAESLRRTRPYVAPRSTREQRARLQTWEHTREGVMQVLAEENPNFNRERFINATEGFFPYN